MEAHKETVSIIDRTGDTVVNCCNEAGDILNGFLVSSKVLSLSSPVFRVMLDPSKPYARSKAPSSDKDELKLTLGQPRLIRIIFHVLHHQNKHVPIKFPLQDLAFLAEICDFYDLSEALKPWAIQWTQHLWVSADICKLWRKREELLGILIKQLDKTCKAYNRITFTGFSICQADHDTARRCDNSQLAAVCKIGVALGYPVIDWNTVPLDETLKAFESAQDDGSDITYYKTGVSMNRGNHTTCSVTGKIREIAKEVRDALQRITYDMINEGSAKSLTD
ncbi:hypothetical protein TWF970_008437 [Orbilia oligospora]|uniref:BTB domain-containing protein n=1 Tax=Orbilia oligospora TaxID=2813651 RepID=A0A7C8RGJ5_ORBOL|nr:hypothetical protein TWF970_008437 [Orbilia oligospora]